MRFDWLVVGAGFTGATLAERLASVGGQQVLVIDKREHIAGNAYDHHDSHGVLVHEYGPHLFHTNSKRVWDYLSTFTSWHPYEHRVLAEIDGQLVPVPFNLTSLHRLFPASEADVLEETLRSHFGYGQKVPILRLRESSNSDLKGLADFVYDKLFYGYTIKQWDLTPEQLSPSVTGRIPVLVGHDDRYFHDEFQALPRYGYTEVFREMLSQPGITLELGRDLGSLPNEISYDRMIYTGPLDEFFKYKHGPLPYRSLRFDFVHHDADLFQSGTQINYPNDHDYTRITEFKHATGQSIRGTTVAVEFPQPHEPGQNVPYYPIPRDENKHRYSLYANELERMDRSVVFAGRLADYRYYNMDQAVARALSVFDSLNKRTH